MNFRKRNIENLAFYQQNRIKKRNPIITTIKIILLLVALFSVGLLYSYSHFVSSFEFKEEKSVKITKNDTYLGLGNKIEEFDNFWYKIYIKNNTPDFKLLEGTYRIPAGSNLEESLKALDKPIFIEESITILEGWNIFDIDLYLKNKGLIESGEYISYVENKEKIKALGEFFPFIGNQITLEGFLYPDTYKVNVGKFKINNFVIKKLENFENKVYNKLFVKDGKQIHTNNTINDVVNLASIVEKEERNPKEKSTVAGILKKRLNSGWKIGADITVCYPYRLTSQECKMVVTKYINTVNDYNTRTKTGLPKTPIGNPTFESINATLNHKETNYWFYLHNVRTGKIYYAEDNAGHERNKRLYMR